MTAHRHFDSGPPSLQLRKRDLPFCSGNNVLRHILIEGGVPRCRQIPMLVTNIVCPVRQGQLSDEMKIHAELRLHKAKGPIIHVRDIDPRGDQHFIGSDKPRHVFHIFYCAILKAFMRNSLGTPMNVRNQLNPPNTDATKCPKRPHK